MVPWSFPWSCTGGCRIHSGVCFNSVTFPIVPGMFDIGDISRNCTEDGWSEPFPHYYDACGFDENETESDNQVGINLTIKNKWGEEGGWS